eukprot:67696_1
MALCLLCGHSVAVTVQKVTMVLALVHNTALFTYHTYRVCPCFKSTKKTIKRTQTLSILTLLIFVMLSMYWTIIIDFYTTLHIDAIPCSYVTALAGVLYVSSHLILYVLFME